MISPPPLRAVLDANVLFPIALCDTLLRVARTTLYEPYWNDMILEELERNLVKHDRATPEKARRRRASMQDAFPQATVRGYEALLAEMTNDRKDRHVLATAIHVGAQIIVTQNLRHFPLHALALFTIEAQTADTFLTSLLVADPDMMRRIVVEQAAALRDPPLTVAQVLNALAVETPSFAAAIGLLMRREDAVSGEWDRT